jgi:hypothetical protein
VTSEEDWSHKGKEPLHGGTAGMTSEEDWSLKGKDLLYGDTAGLTCCITGGLCSKPFKGGGKRLSRSGKRVTTEVFVEGKRKRFSQSIQCTEPDCGVLCCAESRASGAVVELSQRKQLMEWYVSHSDVKSYGICKTALGPAVFWHKNSFLCLPCFVRLAGISTEHAFHHENCFLCW